MLKIRLSRVGKSHTPIYRLVVAEKSRAVKRENLEILGLYNPTNKEDKFQVKKDRVLYWIGLGAQPSDTARNLLCDFDVLPKKDKIKVVHGKATKKKADKEAAGKKPEVAIEATEPSGENSAEETETTEEVVTEENTEAPAEAPEETSKPAAVEEVPAEEKSRPETDQPVAETKEKSEE